MRNKKIRYGFAIALNDFYDIKFIKYFIELNPANFRVLN